MLKLGGHEKELKMRRMGRGGGMCMGKGSGGKHHFVDGECEHCGMSMNKPVVKTNTKAKSDDSEDRGGKEDIKYPHERE